MVCRLCLQDLEDLVNIFDECGDEFNMAEIVGKYFWFEPFQDDPISTSICRLCWLKVCDFHEFYEMVENAHRHMNERLIVKTENSRTKGGPSANDLINYSSLTSKQEHDELGEVPFNMLIEDEPGITVSKAAPIAIAAEDSLYTLSNLDAGNGFFNDDKFHSHDGECDNTSDVKAFMKNMVTSSNTEDFLQKELISKVPKMDNRISTRKSKRFQLEEREHNDNEKNTTCSKIRRGRPKKGEVSIRDGHLNQKEAKVKLNNALEEQDAYKAKMKEIDDQIAQYMTLHCEVCSSKANNFAGLRIHMRDVHKIEKGYAKCCNKKFLKRALLLYHIRQHLDPDCYRCEECNRAFADRQSMRNHFLIKHQKEEDKVHECSQCTKKFVKKYLLEQHRMFTHGDRTTTCKSCNKRFSTTDELTEHNKKQCNYGTMCDICSKVIRGAAAFKRHQLEHQGITIPKVQCDLCGSWLKDKYALNKHKKRHMESKQPHVCDICHKILTSLSAMLRHKRSVHSSDRSYECGVCRKTFKKPISLREHMTTHTGEVLYRCPHCPKTFNSNANMHSHRKKVHPREFEETRKLRKQNAHISVLSNAKKETRVSLVISSGNEDSHHV